MDRTDIAGDFEFKVVIERFVESATRKPSWHGRLCPKAFQYASSIDFASVSALFSIVFAAFFALSDTAFSSWPRHAALCLVGTSL